MALCGLRHHHNSTGYISKITLYWIVLGEHPYLDKPGAQYHARRPVLCSCHHRRQRLFSSHPLRIFRPKNPRRSSNGEIQLSSKKSRSFFSLMRFSTPKPPTSPAYNPCCNGPVCHHLKLYEHDVRYLQHQHHEQLQVLSELLWESHGHVQFLCDWMRRLAGGAEMADKVQGILAEQVQVQMQEVATFLDLDLETAFTSYAHSVA
ncbi:hypothetical protein AB1N83_009945 [Pleurotus pulmonarius]